MRNLKNNIRFSGLLIVFTASLFTSFCGLGGGNGASSKSGGAWITPRYMDEVYAFMSGGYSGQVSINGIPSGRIIKQIPVFSVFPENGYGFDEETKGLLMTSQGFLPWDDSHHPVLSLTNGMQDGRWLFINANNTPRIARIDLDWFETKEIIEIPNSAGNHGSPYITENSDYVFAATRFSVPIPQRDIPIESMSKGEFNGTITMVKLDKDGHMSIDLQVRVPAFHYDKSGCGKAVSKDWCFFTSYNTEQAWKMMEAEASQNDKDYILAFNWKVAQGCISKAKTVPGVHYRNYHPENQPAISEKRTTVKMIDAKDCPGSVYYLPTPKSPHGVDVSPDGELIVGSGKLSAQIAVHSFSKLQKAINDKGAIEKTIDGVPVLKYEATLYGEVQKKEKEAGKDYLCLGPLHTEFDNKGRAYTSCFLSNNIMVWDRKTLDVIEGLQTWYNIGHLSVVGGNTVKPYGKYVIGLDKQAKDRMLPVGPELHHLVQLYDISGDKGVFLNEFPTIGEPHYAQMAPAELLAKKSKKFYNLKDNKHPHATLTEDKARVERKGKEVHAYVTATLTHFKPDKIEVKKGDTVYFHVTNLTQEYDMPHGFAVYGAEFPNLLVMPGQTKSAMWKADNVGVYPFYCTDFCSALHQEMQNYIRVSP
ncbi:MAG: Sec-dependent nitrous-oxide reductase [Spirochaetia bacterium]|nr:Sec-dependent nitrous-oxide reductase [Spirochaetia bacterium]